MARDIEQPVTTEDEFERGTVTSHPAFAQIGAYRTSGMTVLYGSDFVHHGYMTIRIVESQLHRSLHDDHHYGHGTILELNLSEAQWATFVSSPNIGSGVPCTLVRRENQSIPGLPDPIARHDQFDAEMQKKLHGTIKAVEDALAEVSALGIPKSKADRIAGKLHNLLTELRSNLPFVASQFSEHMETTTEKAKQEIHGYMTAVVQRAGLKALTGGQLPLQIEHKDEK